MITDSISYSTERKWDYPMFLLFFIGTNPITTWGSSDWILFALTFVGATYILFVRQERFDGILIYVFIYWGIVNFASYAFLGSSGFRPPALLGSFLKLFIGYAFIKIAKERFLLWYENVVYVLAIISVPFFVLQLIKPEFFSHIPFNFEEAGRKAAGHWNGFIFNYSTFHIDQNSGFAGEDGTFGYYIGLAMIFNLILHDGKLNKRFFVFAVIGLTTLSTTYYLTLLMFGLYFMNRLPLLIKVGSVVIIIPLVILVFQLPFVGDKIGTFITETSQFRSAIIVRSEHVNRLAKFFKDMDDTFNFPIGHGVNETAITRNIFNTVITGTNGISRIAVQFGIAGLIFFAVIYFKLFQKLGRGMPHTYIFVVIIFCYIAANPMERDYFAMGLFWLYFILQPRDIENISNLLKTEDQKFQNAALHETV